MMEERGGGGRGGGGDQQEAKRLRVEEDSCGEETDWSRRRSRLKGRVEDSHRMSPSPVIHVRGLGGAVVEADLVEALNKFGNICYVMMMPFKHQALVEFDSVESAECCLASGSRDAIFIADQQAFFNFSTSQRISRPTNTDDPGSGSKVLLLSVQNALYPISTDVLHSICNPVGNVLRIVIFKRNGIQAMVEFASVEDAQNAKRALNGADIYTGCCTLKIEHARPNRLNVSRNDATSWDYTKLCLLHREHGTVRRRQAILGEFPSNGPHCPLLPLPGNSRYRRWGQEVQDNALLRHTDSSSSFLTCTPPSTVAMVSGLHPIKMNCSFIFNLFCLYGNVDKVKFMKSIPDTALVEMGDKYAVDRAVTHLSGVEVFGQKLSVRVSRQQAVVLRQVFELADGSSSYQSFSLSRNNRFRGSAGGRNVIQPPAAVLHFYNAPPTFSRHQLNEICAEQDAPAFTKFKLFDAKPDSKTLSGLLEFDSKTDAVEALTVLNHHQIRTPNRANLFTLKLSFSTASHL